MRKMFSLRQVSKRATFLLLAGCALFSFQICRADTGGVVTRPAGVNGSVQIGEKSAFSYDSTLNFSTVTKTLSVSTVSASVIRTSTIVINGVTYSWPSADSSGCFNSDGSGHVTIISCAGSSDFTSEVTITTSGQALDVAGTGSTFGGNMPIIASFRNSASSFNGFYLKYVSGSSTNGYFESGTDVNYFLSSDGSKASGFYFGGSDSVLYLGNSSLHDDGSGNIIAKTGGGTDSVVISSSARFTAFPSQTCLGTDSSGNIQGGSCGGGGGASTRPSSFTYVFNAEQAGLGKYGLTSPTISNSTGEAMGSLLFDETSTMTVIWSTDLKGYQGGQLAVDFLYTSSATSGTVNFGAYIQCDSPTTAALDTASFGSINSTSTVTNATTARLTKATVSLTNGDSCANGNMAILKVERSAGALDTMVGYAKLRKVVLYEQ